MMIMAAEIISTHLGNLIGNMVTVLSGGAGWSEEVIINFYLAFFFYSLIEIIPTIILSKTFSNEHLKKKICLHFLFFLFL